MGLYQLIEDFEDDIFNFSFTYSPGPGNWYRSTQKGSYNGGSYAFRSPYISDEESTSVYFSVTVPSDATDAKLDIAYTADSENSADNLRIYIDGVQQLIVDGTNLPWYLLTMNLSSGTHNIECKYRKDNSNAFGYDAGFIDYIRLYYTIGNPPNQPTNLSPSGTSTSPLVLTTLTPTVNWTFSDPDVGDTQEYFQVLVYDSAGVLKHDSGQVLGPIGSYTVSTGLSWGTKYYWKVRTWDSKGDVSSYSADAWILINQGPTASLTNPYGISTAPTIYNDTLQPSVDWIYTDPNGNAQKSVQIKILDGDSVVWDSGEIVTTGTTYTVPSTANLVYDKTYEMQIRAKDSVGTWGAYSDKKYLHLNRSPNASGNLNPAGTSTNPQVIVDNLSPTLTWTFSDEDPTDIQGGYQVLIYDESNSLVKESGVVTSSTVSYAVPASTLLSGKTYHWRVMTKDQHGQWGPYSGDQYFHTNAAPNTPSNQAPAGGSSASPAIINDDLTPVLRWTFGDPNSGDTQSAYQLRLYNEVGTLLYDSGEAAGDANSHEISTAYKLAYGTKYQWEVRTKDNWAVWSNYTPRGWIQPKVGAPQGLSATVDNYGAKIVLDWIDSLAEGVQGYNVYRSITSGGPYTKLNSDLVTVSNYADDQISTGQTYYYVVEVYVNAFQVSSYSAEVSAQAIFYSWYIGYFKFEGPTKISKKRERIQSKRTVLGRNKQVVQDRGYMGEVLQLEIWLTDDAYSTGQSKYDTLMSELSKTTPLSVRDPFGRVWKVAPGAFDDDQILSGKLEYVVKFDLTEVD